MWTPSLDSVGKKSCIFSPSFERDAQGVGVYPLVYKEALGAVGRLSPTPFSWWPDLADHLTATSTWIPPSVPLHPNGRPKKSLAKGLSGPDFGMGLVQKGVP